MKIIILILFLLASMSFAVGIDDNDNTSLVGHKVEILNPYPSIGWYHDFCMEQTTVLDEKGEFILVQVTSTTLFGYNFMKKVWIQRNWIYSIDF